MPAAELTRSNGIKGKFDMNRSMAAVLITACALSWVSINDAAAQTPDVPSPIGLAPSAPELNRADLDAWLDGFVPFALQKGEIAGAVVLVLKDGGVLLEKGYGSADIDKKIAMDPQSTVLGLGSVSKLFTWTAVMQQVEQGKLDLDRDVNDYLDIQIPAAFGKPITLRNLMTHTAGFAERTFRNSADGVAPRALREYMRDTPAPDRIYPPGQVPAYSNYGAMLAGYIVERVSSEPFVTYIQHHILEPLDMPHSTFERPPPDRFTMNLAKSYPTSTSNPNPNENEEPAGDPSGHLVATASDLSHFMLAHLQQGQYGNALILKPETAALMHSPAFVAIPGANPISLGFFRTDYNGRQIIAHMGDIADFHADVELLTNEHIGFLLILNSSGRSMGVLNSANALRSALFRRFMDRYFPTSLPDEPTLPTAKEHAQLAAGEYRMTRRYSGNFMEAVELLSGYFAVPVRITVGVGDTIETPGWLSFEDGHPQQWREVRPFVWRQVGGMARVNMALNNGRVNAFFPSNVPPAWLNERVPLLWSASLNAPLIIAAIIVLFVALLSWPVSILVRRKHGNNLKQTRSVRLTHWAVLMATLFLLGWAAILIADVPSKLGFEYWIRFVQFIGLIATVGAGVALWNALVICQATGNSWAKIWNTLVAFALLELVWFSFAFHLISLKLNY